MDKRFFFFINGKEKYQIIYTGQGNEKIMSKKII